MSAAVRTAERRTALRRVGTRPNDGAAAIPPDSSHPAKLGSLWHDARGLVTDFARFGGRRLARALVLMIAGGALEGVGLAMLVPIISLLAPEGSGRWQAIVTDALPGIGLVTRSAQLVAVLAAFCVLVGVRAAVLTARDRLIFDLTLGYVDDRRRRLITALARAPWSVLARLRHARIAHILSAEIARLDFACAIMLQIAAAGITLTVQAALMLWLSPLVAGMALLCALAGLLVLVPLSRRAADVGHKITASNFRMAGEAAHFLGGLKIAVAHDQADAFVARVGIDAATMRAERDRQQRFQNRVAVASASLASLVGAAVVLGAVTLGISTITLCAALVVLARMSGPVRALQTKAQQLFSVLPAFTTAQALGDELGKTATDCDRHETSVPRGGIRFDGVGFAYPHALTPVFGHLDLAIGAGEMVGLSGPSGTGKTSFVDLLTGLLTPDAGRILVGTAADATGGVALGPAVLAAWRRRLAYVPQDSYLINASIRDNLCWGGAIRSDDMLLRALNIAGAGSLVAAMPAGLDTIVDERGTGLSGGERQRVANRYGAIGIQYIVAGRAVGSADGRPVVSPPGTVMILDYARPFSITDQETRTVVNVALPRDAFPSHATEAMEWHGAVLSGAPIAPLAQFMTTLDQALPSLPAAAGPILADAFTALLTVALGEAPLSPLTSREATLIRRAGQLIDDRIASPDLDPAWLANKLKVSRTELYSVLEPFGGVARFILKRRLARARAALENPADQRRIGAIAYAYGFTTEASFARSFRAAFGTTARAVQQAARTRGAINCDVTATTF